METRTAGSASGLGKRTSSNAGTAPQADSTVCPSRDSWSGRRDLGQDVHQQRKGALPRSNCRNHAGVGLAHNQDRHRVPSSPRAKVDRTPSRQAAELGNRVSLLSRTSICPRSRPALLRARLSRDPRNAGPASHRRQIGQCYGAASGATVIAPRGSRRHDRLWRVVTLPLLPCLAPDTITARFRLPGRLQRPRHSAALAR